MKGKLDSSRKACYETRSHIESIVVTLFCWDIITTINVGFVIISVNSNVITRWLNGSNWITQSTTTCCNKLGLYIECITNLTFFLLLPLQPNDNDDVFLMKLNDCQE